MQNNRTPASNMALGGIFAALALLLMNMGTLIPVATYACPVLCAMLLQTVLKACGQKIAWAWYGAVAILSVLMAPDKEAAAVFLAIGYYPIVKPKVDNAKGKWVWKTLLFNISILSMYWVLMQVFGLAQVTAEFSELGTVMTAILVIFGNITFFLLDHLLGRGFKR